MPNLREWRALVRRDRADEYVAYVNATGIAEYRRTPGNLWAAIAVRPLDDVRAEVVTLSLWTDNRAIEGFAGSDITRARYFPEDDAFLLTRPETVLHYQCEFAG